MTWIQPAPASPFPIGTIEQTFLYDSLSRRLQATDDNEPTPTTDDAEVTWTFDSLGRQIEESLKIGSSGTKRSVKSHYDSSHRSKEFT